MPARISRRIRLIASFLATLTIGLTVAGPTAALAAPGGGAAAKPVSTTIATTTTTRPATTTTAKPAKTTTTTTPPAPILTTGQPDYSPGSVVDIHGSGFAPSTQYAVPVKRPDGSIVVIDPATHAATPGWQKTTTDTNGVVAYNYQLDGIFGSYEARAYPSAWAGDWSQAPIASVTFTDGPLPNSVTLRTWRTTGGGAWITGTLNGNNSDYKEGETVPFQLDLTGVATSGNPYTFGVCRDATNGSRRGYTMLKPFNTSRAANPGGPITSTNGNFSGVNVTINSATETNGQGGCNAGQLETLLNITVPGGTTAAFVLWGGRLASPIDPGVGFGNGASSYPGGSLAMTLENSTKSSGINPNGIVQLATITVTKVVDSGTVTPDQWCFNISPNPNGETLPKCPAAGTNSVQFLSLPTGNYTVTETSIANYVFASGAGTNCTFSGSTATATVTAGTPATNAACTFHNKFVPPTGTLVVKKHVVNSSGGGLAAANFSVHVKNQSTGVDVGGSPAAGSETGTQYTVAPGTYTISEDGPPQGYTQTSVVCDGATTATVTVTGGGSNTCTITNTDVPAKLTVTKVVNNNHGGTKQVADFPLSVTTGSTTTAVTSGAQNTFSAGTYTVSETNQPGYTGVITGDCAANGSITLAVGDVKSCTITNSDQAASLTVIKHVVNNNGGSKHASDFTITVGGGHVSPNATFAGAESPGTTVSLDAGSYTVDEGAHGGYTKSLSADCSGTIALGQSKTCTITNTDQTASVTLTKVVQSNHGGNAGVNDFGLTVGGTAVTSGQTLAVNSNTPIALNEAGLGGYSFVSLTGDPGCPAALGGTVTLAEGQSIHCTITNADQQSTLTVVKDVQISHGGTAQPNDFHLTINGGAVSSGVATNVLSNTTLAINETQLQGYSFVNITGDPRCPAVLGGTITLNEGENVTCTIHNADQAGSLTVIKHVINNNGGSKNASNFSVTVTGGHVAPNATFAGAESPGTVVTLDAGSYSVDEGAHAGYTKTLDPGCSGTIANGQSKTCTITNDDQTASVTLTKVVQSNHGGNAGANDFGLTVGGTPVVSGGTVSVNSNTPVALNEAGLGGYSFVSLTGDPGCPTALGGTVTLAEGQSISCTITNADQQSTLTVVKDVQKTHGGTAQPDDFHLTINGGAVSSGVATNVNSNAALAINETQLSGYTFVNITGDSRCPAVLGGTITLNEGENVTCTIHNADQAASLTVIKHVINNNGGSKNASNFSVTVTGGHVAPNATFPGAESPGTVVSLDAGSYSVDEGAHDGYTKTLDPGCSGTIANGQSKTCTITNDDQAGTLTVIKHVITDNGGKATAASFTMNVSGGHPSPSSFPGAESPGTSVAIDAGTFSVSESGGPAGYTETLDGCSGTIGLGEAKTCTITNNDDPLSLQVTKVANPTHVPENGGSVQYTITVKNTSTEPVIATSILDDKFGELATACGLPKTIAVNDTITCVFTRTISGEPSTPHTNTAVVTAHEDENRTVTGQASATVTFDDVLPSIDVTKSTTTPVLNGPGGPVTYTVTVKNNSVEPVTLSVLTDDKFGNLDAADVGHHTWTSSTCNVPRTIATGATYTCSFVGVVSGTTNFTHTNTVTGTATDNEGNPTTDTSSVTVTVQQPDLTIGKSTTTAVVNPGDPINYTIVVGNNGPGTATNVTVSDSLPGATGVSWSISPAVPGCTINGSAPNQSLSCTFASLGQTTPPSSTPPVTIKLVSNTTRQSCGTLSNTAKVQADNNPQVSSGNPTTILLNCQPSLVVTKVACPVASVVPGGLLTYTINYSNPGTAAATSAMLVDTLPAGTEVADAGGGTVTGQPGSQTVTWNLGTLAVNASGSKTLVVLVDALSGTLSNSVTLSASNVPAEKNGTSTTTTPISNAGAITHGSAYGLDADALILPLLNEVARVDTVAPGTPPAATAEVLSVGVLGVAQVDAVRDTSRSSVNTESVSTSTSETVGVNLLGGAITADVVKGVSQSVAGPFAATSNSAGSTFANLKINGTSITNVVPGQSITVKNPLIPSQNLASVVLQEETKSATSTNGKFTATHSINMLHVTLLKPLLVGLLTLPKGAEIIVGHAQTDATYPSGLACGTSPSTVSGNAFSAFANGTFLGNTFVNAQTGDASITPFGGTDNDGAVVVALPGFATATGVGTNSSTGSLTPNPNATSNSRITGATILGGIVTADVLDVTSTSNANGTTATTNFNTTFTNVQVHVPGVAQAIVLATVAPNTTFRIPVSGGILLLVLNEQIRGGNGTKDTEGTVNAVHAYVLNGSNLVTAEVIVAHAHSDAHKA